MDLLEVDRRFSRTDSLSSPPQGDHDSRAALTAAAVVFGADEPVLNRGNHGRGTGRASLAALRLR
jgi:hypothetical protein